MVVSRLTHSRRLPAILRHLVAPIYAMDGIPELGGRPDASAAPSNVFLSGSLDAAMAAIWGATEGLFLLLHSGQGCGKRSPLEVALVRRLLGAKPRAAAHAGAEQDAPETVGIISPHKLHRADLQQAGLGADAKTVDEYQVCGRDAGEKGVRPPQPDSHRRLRWAGMWQAACCGAALLVLWLTCAHFTWAARSYELHGACLLPWEAFVQGARVQNLPADIKLMRCGSLRRLCGG